MVVLSGVWLYFRIVIVVVVVDITVLFLWES